MWISSFEVRLADVLLYGYHLTFLPMLFRTPWPWNRPYMACRPSAKINRPNHRSPKKSTTLHIYKFLCGFHPIHSLLISRACNLHGRRLRRRHHRRHRPRRRRRRSSTGRRTCPRAWRGKWTRASGSVHTRLAPPVREMASSMVYRAPLKKSRFVTIAPTAPPLAVIPDTTPSDLHPQPATTKGVRILYINQATHVSTLISGSNFVLE